MLQKLAIIFVFISCSWTVQSQVAFPLRKEAPIAVDLYWTKSINLIEDGRYEELQILLDGLTSSSLELCEGFDRDYAELKTALGDQNDDEITLAFTQFITKSIVEEIHGLSSISEPRQRKTVVLGLFKELIAIQKYIKELDFDLYRQLVNCFRRLNQLYPAQDRLERFITEQEYLSINRFKC